MISSLLPFQILSHWPDAYLYSYLCKPTELTLLRYMSKHDVHNRLGQVPLPCSDLPCEHLPITFMNNMAVPTLLSVHLSNWRPFGKRILLYIFIFLLIFWVLAHSTTFSKGIYYLLHNEQMSIFCMFMHQYPYDLIHSADNHWKWGEWVRGWNKWNE